MKACKTDMDTMKPQIRPSNRSIYSIPKNNPKKASSNLLLTVGSIAVSLALLGFYFFFSGNNRGSFRYGIMIDGGSTGTRIHVFRYRFGDGKSLLDFGSQNYWSKRVNPGLSTYAEQPSAAAVSLAELVEFAKGKVPVERRRETEIRLMATAGMRLLDSPVRDRILDVCRKYLRSSGFSFQEDWASVISGSEEGIYAWVIANYAFGTLGSDPKETVGIIELGGASAQVTFATLERMPPELSGNIGFDNITYSLYSQSFLHFGQNEAFDSLRRLLASGAVGSAIESLQKGGSVDPCMPKGYLHDSSSLKKVVGGSQENKYVSSLTPGGNFSLCWSAAVALLQNGKDAERCFTQPCSAGAEYMPRLEGKFLATENFFYTSKFFGLEGESHLSSLKRAGEKYCSEDWSSLKRKHPSFVEEDLLRYCFSSAYIVAFLHDNLGIPLDNDQIEFANQVRGIPLDWALGAFILLTNAESTSQRPVWINSIIGNDSSNLVYLIGVSTLLLVVAAWSVIRWRKPQLKTVYDLEKGRYIVTRVK